MVRSAYGVKKRNFNKRKNILLKKRIKKGWALSGV